MSTRLGRLRRSAAKQMHYDTADKSKSKDMRKSKGMSKGMYKKRKGKRMREA